MGTSGPESHANWLAFERSEPTRGAIEVPLYSDAWFLGEIVGCGPYQVFNLVRVAENYDVPALTLRIDLYGPGGIVSRPMKDGRIESDFTTFTGASLPDEIAVLLALAHGVRVAAGFPTRSFEPGKDPRGMPGVDRVPPPGLMAPYTGVVVPAAKEKKRLTDAMLATYKDLAPEPAVALVRAARSYRDALWLADSHPELAWLLMVSALETAAVQHVGHEIEPEDALRAAAPRIVEALDEHAPDLAKKLAPTLAPLFKATNRFIKFVDKFGPPAPAKRPPEFAQFKWTRRSLNDAMSMIYGLRSSALHAGRPFPPPLCAAPSHFEGAYEERPLGIASGTATSWWSKDDLPMNLHLFEYVARHALLNWWTSLAKPPAPPDPSPSD